MTQYYRALRDSETNEQWEARSFTSFHNATPAEWTHLYYDQRVRSASKYPLHCERGLYLSRAVEAFIHAASSYKVADIWSKKDLRDCSELDGVCAFTDPAEALKYCEHNPYELWGLRATSPLKESGYIARPKRVVS
jgi:hypothetical protein